ncbi:3-methylcrotonyl-CoA carboxylase subunit alpha [Shewanella sp. NFH-SH190041]|uniref:acetyl-CoA carboxylase biotin carboxylase subunit n=1 Tax=Shewanella sp. NFH-SH190041 TaxID=2950245 RepID=UPI0021C2EC8C|nr:acetyl/propionyl/methylcrotonyl-CoA carboxylase subunit alpha [Shewanella sp. NFH-SH190041]BDM65148.1 3-methylcrotonyl-CoA carboxylase subunit alpha [Shewanella sp. NFH-SH190041]
MLSKLLIANRGEIACRVIRTAHAMGLKTVAVYSEADRHARHVQMADEACYIGPSAPAQSYLKGDEILAIAQRCGADAIHPGYGFLSENADFASACEQADIRFVGPGSAAIDAMGSKSAAKTIMAAAGVPLVPGYHGDEQSDAVLLAASKEIGYPQLIKAAFGGGGKGMRVVEQGDDIQAAIDSARREASFAFGNDKLLIERYLRRPRHVEVQVFADTHGNCVYLSDRDCSVQRRHQKVIEEAPAPGLSDTLRRRMGEAAVAAAKAINYVGAGTVEFLLDTQAEDEATSFFFMEMNTRLQVEHPVTEKVTGQDLVSWQLQVAAGLPLPLSQAEIIITGHAFESRIYAEDPGNDFLPAAGMLDYLHEPAQSEYVRIDSGVRQGDEISNYYDPMIAKLITWDVSREQALSRMVNALSEYRITGLKHNLDFLQRICLQADFAQAKLCTDFIPRHSEALLSEPAVDINAALPVAALYRMLQLRPQQQWHHEADSPWHTVAGLRLGAPNRATLMLLDDSHKVHKLQLSQRDNGYQLSHDGQTWLINGTLDNNLMRYCLNGHQQQVQVAAKDDDFTLFMPHEHSVQAIHFRAVATQTDNSDTAEQNPLNAPMNGTIVTHLVECGEPVSQGQGLMVMEAMKMEYTISAPADGRVNAFFFAPGELVADSALLLDFIANQHGDEGADKKAHHDTAKTQEVADAS